jgi:uncharacterized membrane protein
MRLRTETVLSGLMVLVMAGFGLWGHFGLPDVPIAIHYDIHGQADGFAPRDQAMLVLPGLALCLHLGLFSLLPVIARNGELLSRSSVAYGAVGLATIALLTTLHIALVLNAAGLPVSPVTVTTLGGGLLLVVTGNYLPKARRNHFIGVRTPWTLADERVWDKTHRFAGPLLMLGGVAIVVATFVAPPALLSLAFMAGWAVPVVIILAYSWWVHLTLRG